MFDHFDAANFLILISLGALLLTEYENIDGQLQRDEIKVVYSLRIHQLQIVGGGGGGVAKLRRIAMVTGTTDCLNEQHNFACASFLLVHFYAILEKEISKCTIF